MTRRVALSAVVTISILTMLLGGSFATAASNGQAATVQGLSLLVGQLSTSYVAADQIHDAAAARRIRAIARISATTAATVPDAATPTTTLRRLERALTGTRIRLQPWPFVARITQLCTRAQRQLDAPPRPSPSRSQSYALITAALDQAAADTETQATTPAEFQLALAYGYYIAGPAVRLQLADPQLAKQTLAEFWGPVGVDELITHHASAAQVHATTTKLAADIGLSQQLLGDVHVSRTTIIADAAIIVFREGLEAVLILAAITASFVGERRYLRRLVLAGALVGLLATAATWLIAHTIVNSLSNGGLEPQAITGLLAIAVLLVVTNWFFHRVYWSEWISRFNRRRKTLERLHHTRFISRQALGFIILGLTSVYREGLETVLFLQSLETSAGTKTTMTGVGIGLTATLTVGTTTFLLQRKLPYKRMLITTGILIAGVLAIMVGTTTHAMQGIGWIPTTQTPFQPPLWANTWLGIYPTWQTITAQLAALLFVLGSYAIARQLHTTRRRRRSKPTTGLGIATPTSGAIPTTDPSRTHHASRAARFRAPGK